MSTLTSTVTFSTGITAREMTGRSSLRIISIGGRVRVRGAASRSGELFEEMGVRVIRNSSPPHLNCEGALLGDDHFLDVHHLARDGFDMDV